MSRPKRTPKDLNHHEIKKEFMKFDMKPLPIYCEDVADIGGESLDINVWFGMLGMSIEIKNPERDWLYKEGEVNRLRNPAGAKVTIETKEQVKTLMAIITPYAQEFTYRMRHLLKFAEGQEIFTIHEDRIPKALRE
jgi:hypothetical protein